MAMFLVPMLALSGFFPNMWYTLLDVQNCADALISFRRLEELSTTD